MQPRAPLLSLAALAIAVATTAVACSSDSPEVDGSATAGSTVTEPASTRVVVEGLDGPTQIAHGPDGQLLIAQLAGDEADASGQILVVDVDNGSRRVLMDGLDKPTGVAWTRGSLFVMVRRSLLRAEWAGGSTEPGETQVVMDGLPFNGRSEGTLTVLNDGRLLWETTGALVDNVAVTDSGTLWIYDPATDVAQPIATGLKNAYAHTQLADGRIVTTEIGDNIANPPVEEINIVDPAAMADFGWPNCPGDQSCTDVSGPLAVFPPSATPTGVARLDSDLYVALFVTGEVVRISADTWRPGDEMRKPVPVLTDLAGPHTLLARPNGELWISEHLSGRVIAWQP